MTSTTATPSSSSTAAVPHTLTTPFVPPPDCRDQFITTTYTVQSSVITLLASGPLDPRFAACQPSGWDVGPTSFQFSPAVCPSGWGAYRLGFTTSRLHESGASYSTFTTAYCCSRFTLDGIPQFQVRGISSEACFQNRGTEHYGPSTGMRVHNAWHISWASSDVASLTPAPPTLPCPSNPSVVIPSWTPGATVDPGLSGQCSSQTNDGVDRWSGSTSSGFQFLAIGLPVIGVVLIAAWAGWWWRRRSRRRREKLERAQALALQLADQEGVSRPSAGLGQPKET